MIKLFTIAVLLGSSLCVQAQEMYSLQKCRELALQNNRQLKISNMTVDVAENTRKAAKTKYLPRVDALAGYQHFSREISLLSDDQKNTLSNLGTNTFGQLGGQIVQNLSSLAQQGVLSPQVAQQLGQLLRMFLHHSLKPVITSVKVSMMRSVQTRRTYMPEVL